jgi:hypothetical protein
MPLPPEPSTLLNPPLLSLSVWRTDQGCCFKVAVGGSERVVETYGVGAGVMDALHKAYRTAALGLRKL